MVFGTIKKVNNINITLRYLLLRVTSKKFNEKKVLLNCFNRSWI